jgi:hypothetical protein
MLRICHRTRPANGKHATLYWHHGIMSAYGLLKAIVQQATGSRWHPHKPLLVARAVLTISQAGSQRPASYYTMQRCMTQPPTFRHLSLEQHRQPRATSCPAQRYHAQLGHLRPTTAAMLLACTAMLLLPFLLLVLLILAATITILGEQHLQQHLCLVTIHTQTTIITTIIFAAIDVHVAHSTMLVI